MSQTNRTTDQNIKYDVRVVRLAKSTAQTKIRDILTKMKDIHKQKPRTHFNLNICLGHFDVMIIDQVPASEDQPLNPMYYVIEDYQRNRDLAGILESKLREKQPDPKKKPPAPVPQPAEDLIPENGSYYPLYMLLQKPLSENTVPESGEVSAWDKALEAFWKKECNYTVVMRLHQMPDRPTEFIPFRRQLIQHLHNAVNASNYKVRDVRDTGPTQLVMLEAASDPIECVFYDSMELGDVVAILKGDLLAQLLQIQQLLYEARSVNSAYSYCGIRFDLLEETVRDKTVPMEKLKKSKLPYVETRFSVKNTYLASRFLRGGGYFVTGSVDALIQHSNFSELKMLKELRNNIVRSVQGNGTSFDFYDTFHNAVTNVGLENDKTRTPEALLTPELYPPIRLKRDFLKWLSREYENTNHPDGAMYAYSLERLVSSLNAMAGNSVTDALAMLMYKGIKALIEQLEHYYDISRPKKARGRYTEWDRVGSEALRKLQSFLDDWTSATNEILHLESQLFQHPELIPVRVYIPAMILQFQLLIVEKAIEAVVTLDGGPHPTDKGSYEYIPIMLPTSQQHTSTVAIFDPRREPEYNKKSPLCIHVPIHMLYHPYRISLLLCHEVAHYCGSGIRHRETRNRAIFECMSFCAAIRMIRSMDLIGQTEDITAFAEKVGKQIPACVKRAERQFGRILKDKAKSGYLSDVAEAFEKHIPSLIQDPALINGIVYELLDGFGGVYAQLRICDNIQMEGYRTLQEDVDFCLEHLKRCLLELFRECFADIVMILLTGCPFEHYYLRVIHDECLDLEHQRFESKEAMDAQLAQWQERQANRMALVTMAINDVQQKQGLDPWFVQAEGPLKNNEYCADMKSRIQEWNEEKAKRAAGQPSPDWKAVCGDKMDDPCLLTGYEAEKILGYLTECANDIHARIHHTVTDQNTLADETTPDPLVADLRKLINMLMSGHIDWDALQKRLHESRIAYLDSMTQSL